MALVDLYSEIFLIVSGKYKGKKCVVRELSEPYDTVGVIFEDGNGFDIVPVERGVLVKLETPGWAHENHPLFYDLETYLKKHRGDGSNSLRTLDSSQPRVLKNGDVLATDNMVLEMPRTGFNSSALIHINEIGWVELAPRLPIALKGNKKFKLPIELRKEDILITGCVIAAEPFSEEIGRTTICLDTKNCQITVPSCIPLALK